MKYIKTTAINNIILLLTCFFAITVKAENKPDETEKLLRTLDYTIENRGSYHSEKELYIQKLKEKLTTDLHDEERFGIYGRIYDAYITYQTDSALTYANYKESLLPYLQNEQFKYETQLNHIATMTTSGMFKEAFDLLKQLSGHQLKENLLIDYFTCYLILYKHMAEHSISEKDRRLYFTYAENYHDSILSVIPEESLKYIVLMGDKLNDGKEYDKAIELLEPAFEKCKNKDQLRHVAYTISESYGGKGDTENQIYYLAMSAITDLEYGAKEYISLRKLALLLYEKGDIDRAYNYMQCAMQDALSCNARSRTMQTAEIYPIIETAYNTKAEQKQHTISSLFIGISILSLCLIVALIYLYTHIKKLVSARRKLSGINNELKSVNQELTETNLIKEAYLVQYINRCSDYIDQMEKSFHKFAKLAKASKLDELFRELRSEHLIEDKRKDFYKEFDHTFLGLFPNFVTSFNELLIEDERIYPKPGEFLNTELRIFALIRLGITDSTHIAEFLNYSVTTIYNYRSRIRNKAWGDKNEFESKVMIIR